MWIIKILAFNLMLVFITELTGAFLFGAKTPKKLLTAALVNIATNPPVVLLSLCLSLFFGDFLYPGILILEIGVVLCEGFMFSKFETFASGNPYFISFVLNLVSFTSGEIIKLFL